MPRFVQMYINKIRIMCVNWLLGKSLTLEMKNTPLGLEVQLVDTKRRIPYGEWVATKERGNNFKLSRKSAL